MILETERLILREMTQNDFSSLAQILQDPQVMYAYEHDFCNSDIQTWLDRQIARYHQYGFGLWAVILRSTHEMIGQAGLTMQPYRDHEVLEIGYLFQKKFWHHGYATEAARACQTYAFEHLHQEKVHAIIKTDNEASIKVAQRLGMTLQDTFMTQYYHKMTAHYLYVSYRHEPTFQEVKE